MEVGLALRTCTRVDEVRRDNIVPSGFDSLTMLVTRTRSSDIRSASGVRPEKAPSGMLQTRDLGHSVYFVRSALMDDG
jgi:hypothetical protein